MAPPQSPEKTRKATLMVVDDEPDIAQALREFLETEDFQVLTYSRAEEALAAFPDQKVDVLITDLKMPGMDGIALTRALHELDPILPVIVMTAYGSIEFAVASMKAGAVDFLPKPFRFPHALFLIRNALLRREVQEEASRSSFYRELASIDELTGLYNRRFLMETFQTEVVRHQRRNRCLSVLMLDLDDFKQINDRFGHPVGDGALLHVSLVLKRSIRGCDILARLGGEEFVVLLPETCREEAVLVAERIQEALVRCPFSDVPGVPPLTITIGVAEFPADGETPKSLLEQADRALYCGKTGGKNRVIPQAQRT